ncbi:MAG: hypothetical protein WC054_08960, partial [Candidatus Nanopelagicales bacterium]
MFDPERQAVSLVGGDKSGQWKQWYAEIMHVDQSRISQIEAGDITRAELPTVTAYINALGGSV